MRIRAVAMLVFALAGTPTLARAQSDGIFGALDVSVPIPFFIATIDEGAEHPDADLARYAITAWAKAGSIRIVETTDEKAALIRLYWVAASSAYGEMVPIRVGHKRGAMVFIHPIVANLGPKVAARAKRDPLYRNAIVYLTCVHELGHAFGLSHTGAFADIMYSFTYGGDIEEYFLRYRRTLTGRADIAKHRGISADDRERLRRIYAN